MGSWCFLLYVFFWSFPESHRGKQTIIIMPECANNLLFSLAKVTQNKLKKIPLMFKQNPPHVFHLHVPSRHAIVSVDTPSVSSVADNINRQGAFSP